jgi:hypothetical protein
MSENDIAALDGNWQIFPLHEQAAMAFTRALTLYPHRVGSQDLQPLRQHFDDRELVELIYTVSFFNSVNRWTDALGLPQDEAFRGAPVELDTPTSTFYQELQTIVAPLQEMPRPALESRADVLAALSAAATRQPAVAKRSTVARPKPDVAPVTRILFTQLPLNLDLLKNTKELVPGFATSVIPEHHEQLGAADVLLHMTPLIGALLGYLCARYDRAAVRNEHNVESVRGGAPPSAVPTV